MKKLSPQTIDSVILSGCSISGLLLILTDTSHPLSWKEYFPLDVLFIVSAAFLLVTLISGIVVFRKSHIPWRNCAALFVTHLTLSLLYQYFSSFGFHTGGSIAFVGLVSGIYLVYGLLPLTALYIITTLIMFIINKRRQKRNAKNPHLPKNTESPVLQGGEEVKAGG